MKVIYLTLTLLFVSYSFSQSINWEERKINSSEFETMLNQKKMRKLTTPSESINLQNNRVNQCVDTLSYGLAKEFALGLGANGIFFWEFSEQFSERASQTFYHSGPTEISISEVEIIAANNTTGQPTSEVEVSIYEVDGANNPTTLLGTASVSVTATAAPTFYYAEFLTPVLVTGNFAIVVETVNPGSILRLFGNHPAPNTWDEDLARIYAEVGSIDYPTANGNWLQIGPSIGQPTSIDMDFLLGPIVSYEMDVDFSVISSPACLGTPIEFESIHSPSELIENRMFSYFEFSNHFNFFPNNLTYRWDMDFDGATPDYTEFGTQVNYTHPSIGLKDVLHVVETGLFNTCLDYDIQEVEILHQDDATFEYPSNLFCSEDANPIPTKNATGIFTVDVPGLEIDDETGEVDLALSTPGSYQITFTTDDADCPDMYSVNVIYDITPTVTAAVTDNSICFGLETEISVTGDADSYSWNNGVGAGDIHEVSPTADITYTVTGYSVEGCPATDDVFVEVRPLDDVTFNYISSTLCSGGANETPTGVVSTGVFSVNNTDLEFADVATGEIDMSNTLNGVYEITFTVNMDCPNEDTKTITVTDDPEADFSYSATEYCNSDANQTPIFDAGASSGNFSVDITGLSINTNTGVINVSASTPGIYEVTNTIPALGACAADAASFTVEILELPSATISGTANYCDNDTDPIELTIAVTGNGPWDVTYTDGTTPVVVTLSSASETVTITDAGTYTISEVEDDNGCTNSGTGSAVIVINTAPTVVANATSTEFCEGEELTLTGSGAVSYIWDNDVVDGEEFTPEEGVVTYTVTGTDGNNCSNTDQITVTVNEFPEVTHAAVESICIEGAGPFTILGASPAGGTYTGSGVTGDSFNPLSVGVGIFTITYTYETAEGCSDFVEFDIEVKSCNSLNENNNYADLSIYPNPTSSDLTISFFNNNNVTAQVVMLTTDGKVVISQTAQPMNQFEEKINVGGLAKGVYFINIHSVNGTHVEKVVIH